VSETLQIGEPLRPPWYERKWSRYLPPLSGGTGSSVSLVPTDLLSSLAMFEPTWFVPFLSGTPNNPRDSLYMPKASFYLWRTARALMPQLHDPSQGQCSSRESRRGVEGGLSLCMAGNRSPVLSRCKAYGHTEPVSI